MQETTPTPKIERPPRNYLMLFCCLFAVGLILIIPLPRQWSAPWRAKILDLGHLPLFAFATVALREFFHKRWTPAILFASAFAGLGEIAQLATSRNGDWNDFFRGVIGSLVAALTFQVFQTQRTFRSRLYAVNLFVLLLVWPALDAYPVLRDAHDNFRDFPALTDFDSPYWLERWWWRQAKIVRVPSDQPGHQIGEATFEPGKDSDPAVTLRAHTDDWTVSPKYNSLIIDFTAPPQGVTLGVSVWDRRRSNRREDRFIEKKSWAPGRWKWRISLDAIRQVPSFDLAQIHQVDIFTSQPTAPTKIKIHKIYLANSDEPTQR